MTAWQKEVCFGSAENTARDVIAYKRTVFAKLFAYRSALVALCESFIERTVASVAPLLFLSALPIHFSHCFILPAQRKAPLLSRGHPYAATFAGVRQSGSVNLISNQDTA